MQEPQGYLGDLSPQEFAKRLNLPIQNNPLLVRAFTHRSHINENPEAIEDNERLEFLGDAVLDFLVGAWLYNHFPEMQEGDLTRLRSALVRTDQLASFARQIGLGAMMRLGRGEDEGGGRSRPALLCGTFEALIGALYLESGIEGVQDFMHPLLQTAAKQIILSLKAQDPKSLLQEWAQSNGFGTPTYRTVAASGPDHAKIFEVVVILDDQTYGSGKGPSKQAAAKSAAHAALKAIAESAPSELPDYQV